MDNHILIMTTISQIIFVVVKSLSVRITSGDPTYGMIIEIYARDANRCETNLNVTQM